MSRLITTFCAVGIVFLFTAVAGAAPISATDLLVYYNFNDNSAPGEAADQSGNGPVATFEGGAAYSAAGGGVSGGGGDRSLDLGAHNNGASARLLAGTHFDPATANNSFSVSFWQNTATITTSNSSFWLVSPAAGGNVRGAQAHVPWGNGTIFFDQAGCCAGGQRLTTGNPAPANQWNHYVFQKDADGNRQIWENGVMRAEAAGGDSVLAFDGNALIGAEYRAPGTNGTNSFEGQIDEFAVWSVALDAGQIDALANGATATSLFIPEPTSMLLLVVGSLIGLPLMRRRRRRQTA